MVKKYFRPFICAVCATMSVICGIIPVFNVYVSAETISNEDGNNGTDAENTSENEVTPTSEIIEDGNKSEKEGTITNSTSEKESESQTNAKESEDTSESSTEKESESESASESESEKESESESEKTSESESEKESESESENESEPEKHDISNAIAITMRQDTDVITPVDEIKHTVSVAYKDAVDSKITYVVDPSLDVKSIEVGANTYLEGGKAVIVSAAGESEVKITATMDLSSYDNINKIVFTPKIRSYSGMEAKFTVVMKLKDEALNSGVSEVSCKTEADASLGESSASFSASLNTKFKAASITKPILSITYDGKEYGDKESVSGAIEFGKEFDLNLASIGMETYGKSAQYIYTVTVPSFVTLKEIKVPSITGAAKIKVIAVVGGKEVELGTVDAGSTIPVEKSEVTEVRFEIVPESNVLDTANPGKLVFLNDIKENKGINNASFSANAKTVINGTEYSANSSIISVNVKSRTISEPETQPPQTNNNNGNNSNNSGGNNGGSNGNENPPQTEPETETETENPNDVARKQEESERKEKVKKEALQNEQELKNKQSSILAERLSKLKAQSGSTGSESTAVTTVAKKKVVSSVDKKYANWKVKPIAESMIADFVPKVIAPIQETIIENLIPESNVSKTEVTEWAVTEETTE